MQKICGISHTHLIVHVISANGIRVHQKAAALRSGRRTLGNVRIVLGAPIVAELVSRYQIGFARDDALPVMVSRTAQARVQVERVTVFKVFYAGVEERERTLRHHRYVA